MNIFSVVYDLGNIADWLTAIGTISAVIVALFLSNRDRKPKGKVKASVSYGIDMDYNLITQPISISLEIVNQGLIPMTLVECNLKYKNKRLMFFDGHHKIDKKIEPGERYEHNIPFDPIAKFMASEGMKKYKTDFYFMDTMGNKYKDKIKLFI